MRSWVFSAWLIAPVWTKPTRPRAKTGAWLGGQPDGQPPGGDVIDGAAAGVGFADAVVDEMFVQGQVGQESVLRQRPGVSRAAARRPGCGAWLAGQSAASLSGCPLARSC